MTLILSAYLNIGDSFAMETRNQGTIARISGIIQNLGFQENTGETKEIILDALREISRGATNKEINEAFIKNESEGKQISKEKEARELTPIDKENAYRMWLFIQGLEKRANKNRIPEVAKDVQNVIGQILHEISANLVFDGKLVYRDRCKTTTHNIMDLVKKDGTFDFSNKKFFGIVSKYLLITTDPEKFFSIDKNSKRLVILMASRLLIKEKIDSTARHFKPIMDKWKEDQAPIGIFWRMEKWENFGWYDYLVSANLISISKNNLYENWTHSVSSRDPATGITIPRMYRMRKNTFLFK